MDGALHLQLRSISLPDVEKRAVVQLHLVVCVLYGWPAS